MTKADLLEFVTYCLSNKMRPVIITLVSALDISPEAVRNLRITEKHCSFLASFNGVPEKVIVPLSDILELDVDPL